jgi:hypothetical protein
MENTKENIKQLFALFESKDFPGFVSPEEAQILTQELNDPRPLHEINMVSSLK